MNLEAIKEACAECNHYCEECEMENACLAVADLTSTLYVCYPEDWEPGDMAAIRVLEKSKEEEAENFDEVITDNDA